MEYHVMALNFLADREDKPAKAKAKDAKPEFPDSGREVLRSAVRNWARSPGNGIYRISESAVVGIGALEDFASGKLATLDNDKLNRLAKAIHEAEYLPDIDK